MTLRRRTFLTVGGILLGMLALIALCSSKLMLDRFRAFDEERAEDELRRVLKSVSADLDALQLLAAEWAWQEDACRSCLQNGKIPERWTYDSRSTSSLTVIGVLDPLGRRVASGAWLASADSLVTPPPELDSLLCAIGAGEPAPSGRSVRLGVCVLDGRALSLARVPILCDHTNERGGGSLVLGRWLHPEAAVSPGAFVKLRIRALDAGAPAPDRELKTRTRLRSQVGGEALQVGAWSLPSVRLHHTCEVRLGRLRHHGVLASGRLPSFLDHTRVELRAEMPGRVYAAGLHAVRTVGAAEIGIGLLLGCAILLLLEYGVLRRLGRLHREMWELTFRGAEVESSLGTLEVSSYGNNEIGSVAAGLNQLLAALRQAIGEREAALARMTEARNEAEGHAEARSRFLADMSHEIRTPMGAIIGMAGLLLESDLSPDQREQVGLLNQSANALLQVLNDILDLSKLEQGRMTLESIELRPRDIVEEVGGMMAFPAAAKGLDLVVEVDRSVPGAVNGDPVRLRQILSNLVGNAVKFTERGEIRIEANTATTEEGERLVLPVRDTGVGIAPDRLEAVFEVFTQEQASTARRFGGTGLGLTISRKLAHLMGGSVTATSELGSGSCFRLEIPLVEAEATGEGVAWPVRPDLTTLLVTGSEAGARAVTALLERMGCSSRWCRSAAEAQAFRPAEGADPPRVVLIDQNLPEGGEFELATALRESGGPAAPEVFLLCRPGESPIASFVGEVGLAGVIQKPVRASRLAEIFAALPTAPVVAPPPEAILPPPAPVETGPGAGEVVTAGVVAKATASESAPSAGFRPDLRGYAFRVLVVDSDAKQRETTLQQLTMTGVAAEGMCEGEEAIRRASEEGFDLILLDLEPPELHGLQTALAIRAAEAGGDRRTPIVALAASPEAVRYDRCREAGLDDCLQKPLQSEDLIRVVGRCVATRKEDRVSLENNVGPLDLARLEEISGGDEGFEQSLMEEFLTNVPRLIEQAGQAVAQEELTTGQRVAHTLKGSSGMVGATQLATVGFELEEAFSRGDLSDAETLVRQARQHLSELSVFVRQHFQERAA